VNQPLDIGTMLDERVQSSTVELLNVQNIVESKSTVDHTAQVPSGEPVQYKLYKKRFAGCVGIVCIYYSVRFPYV